MRHAVLLSSLALLAACGSKKSAQDDARPPIDGAVHDGAVDGRLIDAPFADAGVLPACAAVAGTTLVLHLVIGPCGIPGGPAAPQCTTSMVTHVSGPFADPRQFLLEREGVIQIVENDVARATPFLDIGVDAGGTVYALGDEQGLVGLAFHPSYAQNRQFFVLHTIEGSVSPYANAVVRYTTSATDPDHADPASRTVILVVPNDSAKHNGGTLAFGADGFLYVGFGDTNNTSAPEDPMSRAGKILRIDVDHPSGGRPYGIPSDNPYASGVAGAPEVYMIGMRNPWRFSFDRANGDLWVGDVGDTMVEELDVLSAGEQLGRDLGWPTYEGNRCYFAPCDPTGKVFPKYTRLHSEGWAAIMGGEVYRGNCFPDLAGFYFFTDHVMHTLLRAHRELDGSVTVIDTPIVLTDNAINISSDGRGELYISDIAGAVWRLTVAP